MSLAVCLFGVACDQGTPNRPNVSNANTTQPNTNAANANAHTASNEDIPIYTYEIVKTYKHDSKAFTQGLVYHDGFLYESTGQYGESSLRKVRLEDGDVKKDKELDQKYFAEGMTILNGKIYQITWQERTGFVYDVNSFDQVAQFRYNTEGWGLTNDGTNLILSDGSHQLRFFDVNNGYRPTHSISVFYKNKPLMNLNELEYVKGEIWANVWHVDTVPNVLNSPNFIVRINPNDGKIVGLIDLNGINDESVRNNDNVLNGIAYDAEHDRIFITGKRWRQLYEIKIKPKA